MSDVIYFDNSASTKVRKEAIDILLKVISEDYANPSAKHRAGIVAEKYIKEAKELIAKTLKVDKEEIIFTSGGTESNNLALIGSARANNRSGKHIITTSIEHSAVKKPLEFLEKEGYEITVLDVDSRGKISLDDLKAKLREDTILVSIMYVNNEIGIIQDIKEISKLIKTFNKDIIFHVDAVQAYTKLKIEARKEGIDLLSVSGHKVHAPKGIGFLYIAKGIKISPIFFGAGQQNGLRSGTINTNGIAALKEAIKYDFINHDIKIDNMKNIRDYLIDELSGFQDVKLNTEKSDDFVAHIVNVSFKDIRAEVLLHSLEDRGIYVSSGSACSSHKKEKASTLHFLGVAKEYIDGSIRISLSEFNTLDEAKIFISVLKEILPLLRRFIRK